MRIVVVERDAALGLFLKKGLTAEGHDVSWTDRSEAAASLAEQGAPDLLVLDILAEGGDELLEYLRQRHPRTAVLALTSGTTAEERVRCLDLGADDCMAKPFSFQELTARCRALLRRRGRAEEILLTHGGLTLNRISRSVVLDDRPLAFTAKEFRLLEFLLQNAGRCCSRSELLTEVFDLPPDNPSNVVDVYINYLRKKLSRGETGPVIATIRGAGYRLTPPERLYPRGETMVLSSLHAGA